MGSKYRISKQEILPDAQLLARPAVNVDARIAGERA